MTMNDELVEKLAAETVEFLKKALDVRDAQIRSLEQRLSLLEAQPKSLDYKGVWQRALAYERNAVVTHKSALWACLADVRGVEPGTASACWQLAQKNESL